MYSYSISTVMMERGRLVMFTASSRNLRQNLISFSLRLSTTVTILPSGLTKAVVSRSSLVAAAMIRFAPRLMNLEKWPM